jgi:signal transduction histidine kinase/GAF domain-containing protein
MNENNEINIQAPAASVDSHPAPSAGEAGELFGLMTPGLLEWLPQPAVLTDRECRIIMHNQKARELVLGRGLAWDDLELEPEDLAWIKSNLLTYVQKPGITAEKKITFKDRLWNLGLVPLYHQNVFLGALLAFADQAEEVAGQFKKLMDLLIATQDEKAVAEFLLKTLKKSLGFDKGMLAVLERSGSYRILAGQGLEDEAQREEFLPKSPILEACYKEGRPMAVSGTAENLEQSLGAKLLKVAGARAGSVLIVPLMRAQQALGFLLLHKSGPAFGNGHLTLLTELSEIFVKILDEARMAQKFESENQLRNKLYEIGFAAGSVLQLGSLLSLMIRTIAKELKAEEVSLYFFDEISGQWTGKSMVAPNEGQGFLALIKSSGVKLEHIRLMEMKDVTAQVVARGQPEIIGDLSRDSRFIQPSPRTPFKSGLWHPLKIKDKSIGALMALSRQPGYFGAMDQALMDEITPLITFALRSAMLYEEIRREGGRLGSIINSMPEGLLMVDKDFRVIISNDSYEKLWSLGIRIKPGMEFHKAILPLLGEQLRDQKPLLEFLQQCAGNTAIRQESVELELNSGSFLKIVSFPVDDAEGPGNGLVLLHQDVTVEHQIAETRQEFVGMLSHDMRNPLSAIIATLELSLDGSLGGLNDNQQQFLGSAMNDSRRMLEMLNDLLDGYKYEAVELKLEKTQFDITQLISKLVSDFSALAKERRIELFQDTPLSLTVTADEGKLIRVISNLLTNALKFTPKEGRIIVSAADKKQFVQISVQDTGEGISPDELEKVFQKFYQVEKRKLGRKTGTGLGLPLCRKLVDAHGGKIWVESRQGQGSKFIFTLPK